MDRRIFWTIIVLLVFGLVMLSSAGIVEGQKKFGSPYYYLNHQLLYGVLPGLLLMLLFSRMDYHLWKKLSFPVLFFALGLMILPFVSGLGRTLNGATSWVTIHGYTFQPAEPLKFALIIYLAAWFGGKDERIKNWAYGTAPFFTVLAFVALLLILQPDVGTLGIVAIIAIGLFFVAGGSFKHIAVLGLVSLVVLGALVAVKPYRFNRIKALFDPSLSPRGTSYQVNQSFIAIGSGGLWGVGFGHSTQKFGFLPEPIGDSIFAVIAEELGFAGSAILIGLFLALCVLMVRLAQQTSDRFGRLLVLGTAIWVMTQSFINIAAASGVGPLTGIPLPFVSYGGTALVSLLAELGIVLNVAKRV